MEFNEENFNKLNSALNYLGIETDNDLSLKEYADDFKAKFNNNFVLKSTATQDQTIIDSIFGKKSSEYERSIKKRIQALPSLKVEFENGTFKKDGVDLKGDEFLNKMFFVLDEKIKNEIQSLTESSKLDENETINQLQKDIDKYKELNSDLSKKYEESQNNLTEEQKSRKLDIQKRDISDFKKKTYSSILVSDLSNIQRTGFDTLVSTKYDFIIDEQDDKKVIVTDKKGNQILNPDKAGQYYTPAEVLEKEAEKEGVLKKHNGGVTEQTVLTTSPSENKGKIAKRLS